jgi:FAD/FMN-containing dehydrogenase
VSHIQFLFGIQHGGIQLATTSTTRLYGADGTLEYSVLNSLKDQVAGSVVAPGDPGYDELRRVWNGMIDRRPAVIIVCTCVEDVKVAVDFARERGLLLAVRGGGHNVAGFGTCDGGVVADLSSMRSVHVEPQGRTLRADGGATMRDVDSASQIHGLAVPGGIVSTTGIAGLTLGGGQGWLRRTFGMTCDSLLSVEVVTANGEVLTANLAENPDLFWALRGGGGNFGVVTSLEFSLSPVGPMIAFAGPTYPLSSASHVMEELLRFAANTGDEVNMSATWWTIPPAPSFPESLHGQAVVTVGATYVGDPEDGVQVMMPLREIEEPVLDLSGSMPYLSLQQLFDPFFPAGELQYYWKSIYLQELSDAAVSTAAGFMENRPSPLSMAGMWVLGGAMSRVDPAATAIGARNAPFLLEILANWLEPSQAETNIAWARQFFDAMMPFSTGRTNFNFPGSGNEPGFVRAALTDNWEQLVDVKRKYDPSNLFRLNQNIDPMK